MKKLLSLVVILLLAPAIVFAAVTWTNEVSLIPQLDSKYTLGTTSKTWLNLFVDQICLNGDCQTTWAGGSGDGTFSTTSANYWSTLGLAFSTTSTDYWETQQAARGADGAFSTTSANFWSTLGLGHSTTSTAFQLTQPILFGHATGTTLSLTGQVDFDTYTSAILLTGAGGILAEYAGAGCTNQVVEDISALGASTCVSIESEQLGDDDWGEITIASGVATIDDDLIASEHFGDDDWGDITITTNAASVEDDSHAHTASTISGLGTADISGLDISDDTNLAVTYPIILTGDTLSTAFGTTTANTFSTTQTFTVAPVLNTIRNSILSINGTGAVLATSTPTASRFYATSTLAASQFPYASSTSFTTSGIMFANSLTLTTDLTVANGGTGVSTFGCTICILYSTATDGLNAETAFTYSAALDKMTVVNASTTNFTVNLSQILGDGSGASLITPTRSLTIPFGPTTTAWTGTSTLLVGPAPFGFTVTNAMCYANTGTLNAKLSFGATNVPMVRASSTVGQQAISSNNVITKGSVVSLDIGTPASSPTDGSCTFTGPQTSQ